MTAVSVAGEYSVRPADLANEHEGEGFVVVDPNGQVVRHRGRFQSRAWAIRRADQLNRARSIAQQARRHQSEGSVG